MQFDKVSDFGFFNIHTFLHNLNIHANTMYQHAHVQSDVMQNTNICKDKHVHGKSKFFPHKLQVNLTH